jgi:hypothetical protein
MLQEIIAYTILAVAIGYILRKFVFRKKKKSGTGCGTDCGC